MGVEDPTRGATPTPGHEPPLSIPEAAVFLNVTDRWVRRAVRERRIPYLKVGRHVRFLVADLEAFLAGARVEPTPAPAAMPEPYLRRLPASVQRRPGGPRPSSGGSTRPVSA